MNAKEMKSVIIKNGVSINDIDTLVGKFNESDCILRIPSKGYKYGGGLGIEALVVQAISTWARNSKTAIARTYVSVDDDTQGFSELTRHFAGMAYLAMADRIYLSDGETLVTKRKAFDSAKSTIDLISKMQLKNAFKGRKVFFPCLKPSEKNGMIYPLYMRDQVAPLPAFASLVKYTLETILTEDKLKSINPIHIENLSNIVYQLFKNTHEHGSRDESGNIYTHDARGVNFNVFSYKIEDVGQMIGENEQLENYFTSLYDSKPNSELISFLEISIIDSGIGYAMSWLGKQKGEQLQKDEEILATLKCFKKHSSTKMTSSSGNGLYTVIESVKNLKGMFRLRTGAIRVDWSSDQESEIHEGSITYTNSRVVGTVFTVIVPI
jgi:hypothetical protein